MTHNRLQRLWYWTLLAGVGSGYVLRHPVTVLQSSVDDNLTSSMPVPFVLQRRDVDPADFGWIKRWAAIGDSFTAGIGAGTQLGKIWHNTDNWLCSRYDQAYPMVLNAAFGQAVEKFQYVACSGDRSEGIYKQVTEQLDSNLNLVIMTAGGNDLCLACLWIPLSTVIGECNSGRIHANCGIFLQASMIKKCVFLP